MKTGKIGLALSEDILKVSDHNTKTATTTEPKLVPSSDKKGGLYQAVNSQCKTSSNLYDMDQRSDQNANYIKKKAYNIQVNETNMPFPNNLLSMGKNIQTKF